MGAVEFFERCCKRLLFCSGRLLAWVKTGNAVPKSAFGQTLHYLLEQWPRFIPYLDDGQLEISNSLAERSIKPFAMGHKDFLFANIPSEAFIL